MRAPLTVVVDNGSLSRQVTSRTTGLRFKRSAFGGDIDLTCTVHLPRGSFTDLGPGSTVTVYDSRTAGVVWTGDANNPGITDGPAGQLLDLQALGAASRLQSDHTALGYVVQDIDGWQRSKNSTHNANTQSDEKGDGNETLEVSANEGRSVGTDWQGEWIFRAFKRNGLKVGRVRCETDAGVDAANFRMQLRVGTGDDDLPVRDNTGANTTSHTLRATLDGAIQGGDSVVALRVVRQENDFDATKHTWFRFGDIVVRQVIRRPDGSNITTGYTDNTIRANEVIADMIGRGMFPGVSASRVSIAATTYDIDNLSWLDGITMGDALTELLKFEPDLWWTAYGDTFTAGLWSASAPRYTIGKDDGWVTHPGEENTKCNRILVTWTDRKGKDNSTVVTTEVPGIDYTRDADPISLDPGTGSAANAQRAGEQALALLNDPPRAGTAVIRRPIKDEWAGVMVWPHEIMPGCRVVERETGDTLRLTETEYVDGDGTATLTLGDPVRTIEQYLARLERRERRRKKR